MSLFDQVAREMDAADDAALRGVGIRPFQAAGYPGAGQAVGHALGTPMAAVADPLQPLVQRREAGVDFQTDDMKCAAMPGHGDLDAVDEGDTGFPCRKSGFRQAVHVVVVGQRQHLHALACGMAHQFRRR